MNYYNFNIGDYRRRTGHLTLEEHAIYRSLIDTYYLTEKPLCLNHAYLMRTHRVRTESEQNAFMNVLDDFFIKAEDGYYHDHIEGDLAKIYAKSEKARNAANKRWLNNANGMRPDSDGNATAMPPTNPTPNNPLTHFSRPGRDEVLEFFQVSGATKLLAKEFHAHYETRDWIANGNPVADWKALATKWIKGAKKEKSVGDFIARHTDSSWVDL